MMKTFLLLGSGELGKEFTIAAKRYGFYVIAVDKYKNAPAMQVADEWYVVDMLDGDELDKVIYKCNPDYIVPEIEAICVEKLFEYEKKGINVVPSANAVNITMNREKTRKLAKSLGLPTAKCAYAESFKECVAAVNEMGFPCVIKPLMSSSGKGQSVVEQILTKDGKKQNKTLTNKNIMQAWGYAVKGGRGNVKKVIVEKFVEFNNEITLLTITQKSGETVFCDPIEHIQSNGDYVESWQPTFSITQDNLRLVKNMASKITKELGGCGIWGVEFFLQLNNGKQSVLFSELSPRPHDTGMVTMVTQRQNEFELHLRAILCWDLCPSLNRSKCGASHAILAQFKNNKKTQNFSYAGLKDAAALGEFRIFGKPYAYNGRRMGVALASDNGSYYACDICRKNAKNIAEHIKIKNN